MAFPRKSFFLVPNVRFSFFFLFLGSGEVRDLRKNDSDVNVYGKGSGGFLLRL